MPQSFLRIRAPVYSRPIGLEPQNALVHDLHWSVVTVAGDIPWGLHTRISSEDQDPPGCCTCGDGLRLQLNLGVEDTDVARVTVPQSSLPRTKNVGVCANVACDGEARGRRCYLKSSRAAQLMDLC